MAPYWVLPNSQRPYIQTLAALYRYTETKARPWVEMTTNKVSNGRLTGSSQNLGEIATMATLPT